MCGIAGILSVDGGGFELRDRAVAMQRALAHRGPDGGGAWTSATVPFAPGSNPRSTR